jgi:hypothetical protein
MVVVDMLKRILSLLICWPALVLAQNTPGQLGVGNGTGTPPSVPAAGYFYFEALNPISTSWAWVPSPPLKPGKGGIVNCDFDANGNCIQHWFPYPNASCTMGQNWSGTQWVCVTAAEIAAGLQAAGYTVTGPSTGFKVTPAPSDNQGWQMNGDVPGLVPISGYSEDEAFYGPQVKSPAFPVRCVNGLPISPEDRDYCTSHFNPGGQPK